MEVIFATVVQFWLIYTKSPSPLLFPLTPAPFFLTPLQPPAVFDPKPSSSQPPEPDLHASRTPAWRSDSEHLRSSSSHRSDRRQLPPIVIQRWRADQICSGRDLCLHSALIITAGSISVGEDKLVAFAGPSRVEDFAGDSRRSSDSKLQRIAFFAFLIFYIQIIFIGFGISFIVFWIDFVIWMNIYNFCLFYNFIDSNLFLVVNGFMILVEF